MCHCKNIPMGSYMNTVAMTPARDTEMHKHLRHFGKKTENQFLITIDACIASEIAYLWNHDVVTLNSCCGHNQTLPTVIVEESCIPRMQYMGYESQQMRIDAALPVSDKSASPKQTFYLKHI